jgi:hypothetical protein
MTRLVLAIVLALAGTPAIRSGPQFDDRRDNGQRGILAPRLLRAAQ